MTVPPVPLGGMTIPQIGFGMWEVVEPEVRGALLTALDVGYRHFDTAQIYGNEQHLGAALTETEIPRDDLFITTKVWNDHLGPECLRPSVETSLRKLGTDYLDLLLVHYPVEGRYLDAWTDLKTLAEGDTVANVGVSNFTVGHLEKLREHSALTPAVNQVETHVFLQEPELIDYCRRRGILVQAYSPLAHGKGFGNEVIRMIANKHEKSEAQILIRWLVERDLVVIVKSITKHRMEENLDVFDFELDAADLLAISGLQRAFRVGWGPSAADTPA